MKLVSKNDNSKAGQKLGIIRTTVSLTQVVWDMALRMMARKGYNNFSSYCADLIRKDYEEHTKP